LGNLQSVSKTKELIKSEGVTFDAIVANAAVGCDFGTVIPSVEVATGTLRTNVIDTIHFIK
jgi:hypothetical protein